MLFLGLAAAYAGKKQGQPLIDSLQAALAVAGSDTNRVNILNGLSYSYSTVDLAKGINYGKESVLLAQELQWKHGEAWAYNSLGSNAYHQSDFAAALDYYFKALKLQEELGDKEAITILTGNIGNIYSHDGNPENALKYYLRALADYEKAGDKSDISRMQGNIGLLYMNHGNYTKALEYNLKALSISQELGSKYSTANIYGIIGSTYAAQNNFPMALKNQFKALQLSEVLKDKHLIAVQLGNIGEAYLAIANDTMPQVKADSLIPEGKKANRVKAIQYLEQAIAICRETRFLGPLQEYLEKLSEAQEMAGDPVSAFATYRQFIVVRDSVFGSESNVKITNLETGRELALKDKQIEIDKLAVAKKRNERGFFIAGIVLMLGIIIVVWRNYRSQKVSNTLLLAEKKKVEQQTMQLNNTNNELTDTLRTLSAAQEQLIVTEKQKENEMIRSRIAMDIHDDISSELTRISWMSELAKLKFKKTDMDEVQVLLDKITNSSRETIGNLGEIIWTVKPENDTVESLIAHVRNYISRFLTDTSFKYMLDFPEQVPAKAISSELKRNLFLVVKEVLNNAVKYSGASLIAITFRLSGAEGYTLVITDDGKGIDGQHVTGTGNGIKNMQNRMAVINGSCTISSHPGGGTRVTLEGLLS